MPRSEWRSWRDAAEALVAEQPSTCPDLLVDVLCLVLESGSWGDFLTGRWIGLASTRVYTAYVPGFSDARTHQLLDRFVGWLHARGDLDGWQRDVLYGEIDRARAAHGRPPKRPTRVVEHVLCGLDHDRVLEEFAATLEDPVHQDMAPSAVRVLVSHLQDQHGTSRHYPAGSLDPAPMIDGVLGELDGSTDAQMAYRDLLFLVGAFYRWLGATGRLERSRAERIAASFAAAVLGMAA